MTAHPMSCGNLRRFLVGCPCGRAFEVDTIPATIPTHVHNDSEKEATL